MVKLYKRERATATGKHRVIYEFSAYTTGKRVLRSFTDPRQWAEIIARQLANGECPQRKSIMPKSLAFVASFKFSPEPSLIPNGDRCFHFARPNSILGGNRIRHVAHNDDLSEATAPCHPFCIFVIDRSRKIDAKKSCPLAAGTTKQTTSTQKLVRAVCLGCHPALGHETEDEEGSEREPGGRFRCR